MISDAEQADHARSHYKAAANHVAAAGEHLDGWEDASGGVEKMAGAQLSKAAFEIGQATAQHAMGKKHVDSLIGREGYDGNPAFEAAKAASGGMGHELKMAAESHAALHQADREQNGAQMIARHKDLRGHLAKASAHAEDASTGLGKCLEAGDNGSTKTAKVLKGELLKSSRDDFRLWLPVCKIDELPDGALLVTCIANVSDFIDSDGEYFTPEALAKAMTDWAPFGNIREQHNPSKPVGTIRQPTIGKLDGEQPGWWMAEHPETKTPAAFMRVHVPNVGDSRETIVKLKVGLLTGCSVGGSINPGGRQTVEVEVDENGVVLREAA
ncbi:MAG TPA: hypothetical protein VKS22_13285 [Candidatus Binataceae bacterium]|nr:hypothetical protein [Candidatus Binataceae bacterium]